MVIDIEAEKAELLKRYKKLLRAATKSKDNLDKKLIRRAFEVAVDAHKDVRRKSGEPYIYHPIAVAQIVAEEIGLGTTSIVCGLLHDTVEDTYVTLEDVERMFGKKVRQIIDGLTKISGIIDPNDPNYSIQGENFKKMMLTLSEDARVILVKLADRLHNMRTMESMPRHKQIKIAYETFFVYAPLAHRLGLNAIKTELEDLAFKYTEPELYSDIQQKLLDSQVKLSRYINKFSLPIINELSNTELNYNIKGRPKSIYSIARKMKNKDVPFEEVFDIFAVRIVLDSPSETEKADCWSVYSLVTGLYKPNPHRLRDWISTPKGNGYEALHTTVMGPEGKWVEVQIRTKRMDEIAEKGLAAHWKYKNDDSTDSKLDEWIANIRNMLENTSNTVDFIDDLKMNLFSEEIFVFTPAGDLKTMPKGSTVLDFAYEIHSNIGDHCIGAKVNHKLVSLSFALSNGEQIEILYSEKQTPKEDWLDIAKTAKSKQSIKNSLKRNKKEVTHEGEDKLNKIFAQLELENDENILEELVQYYQLQDNTELFVKIALKKIDRHSIKKYVESRASLVEISKTRISAEDLVKKHKKEGLLILGKENLGKDYTLSSCCNPIPGDEVFGFITNVDGVKIHKTNCPNAMHLQANFAYRSIKAQWTTSDEKSFLTGISFTGTDDVGLVSKILECISHEEKINIKSISFESEDGIFNGKIMLFIQNTIHLDNLINKLLKITDIQNIRRIHTN